MREGVSFMYFLHRLDLSLQLKELFLRTPYCPHNDSEDSNCGLRQPQAKFLARGFYFRCSSVLISMSGLDPLACKAEGRGDVLRSVPDLRPQEYVQEIFHVWPKAIRMGNGTLHEPNMSILF